MLNVNSISVDTMAETCVWCDATFETRAELEKHIEEAHSSVRGRIKF